MAEKAGEWMANHKVKFRRKHVPTKVSFVAKITSHSLRNPGHTSLMVVIVFDLLIGCFQVELIEEGPPRKLKVEFRSTETGETATEEFNTVRS